VNALQGKLVRLRAPEPEDLEYLFKWENNTEIWHLSNTLTPFSRYTLKQYIESSTADIYEAKQVRFMIDLLAENNKTIGTIDLFEFDPYNSRVGIGILIADTAERGKGYAGDALETVIHYVFDILKLHQVFCNIATDNQPSIALFKSKGFTAIGEKKDWIKSFNEWIGEYTLQLINSNK
jgi:diamine N-acetyltransferase